VTEGQKVSSGTLEFFREVTKYFMDFLETDFHKRKLPRRVLRSRNSDNLLVGVSLKKYDTYYSQISKYIQEGFPAETILQIKKGQFKTKLPKNVVELIELQISKITKKQFSDLLDAVILRVEQEAVLHKDDFDLALSSTLESAGFAFYSEMIHPFITSLEKPLTNNELGDQDDIFMLEQELVGIYVGQIENKVSEVIRRLIAQDPINIQEELLSVISLEFLKSTLSVHFENLRVADLFHEVQELENNKAILDKQDFYLYFGDISYKASKYPIFYIPINLVKEQDVYQLEFDSQVYINKKALEYIAQEFNQGKGTQGTLKSIGERIIYVSQHKDDLHKVLNEIIIEIENFFELQGSINFSQGQEMHAKGAEVHISNALAFALFDKSDEALVNDYEEILSDLALEGSDLSEAFNQILADFLQKNPEPVGPQVEQEWDDTETSDRLVAQSPIPLNSEQLQILNAVQKPNSKYLVVEGPPGTGKSHTITAIIFNAVLTGKSVLVLSDKKEALDVVEKNITETMNKVRFDQNFQNPILRLGKTGNTYSQILSSTSINDIRTHYRAVKKDIEAIDETIEKSSNSLKQDIELESLAFGEIDMKEISELFLLEDKFRKNAFDFDLEEILTDPQGGYDLDVLRSGLLGFREIEENKYFSRICKLLGESPETFDEYVSILGALGKAAKIVKETKAQFTLGIRSLNSFKTFKQSEIADLFGLLSEYAQCKKPIVGYAFSKSKLAQIDAKLLSQFSYTGTVPSADLSLIKDAYNVLIGVKRLGDQANGDDSTSYDYVALAHQLLTVDELQSWIDQSGENFLASGEIPELASRYPVTFRKLKIDLTKKVTLLQNKLLSADENEFNNQLRYVQLKQKIEQEFGRIPEIDYAARKKNIEQLVITKVAHTLDGRVINFYENNRNDAQTLRNIIKSKQKFPKDQFTQLSEAFPCILAGIRDFAEYIPLHHQMFDLLIIDEASQVSLAQAFPALIRAKKVLILGDKKQFSNIKANQARSDTNREYLSRLEHSFKRNVSTDASQLIRLGKFNIKTSVLDFFEFISNYNMQLIKHFRGYKEIISYSNKYFYRNSLQVMKIRGKSIDEVIKFSYVKATINDEVYPNTNQAEVHFIIEELKKLKDQRSKLSVGIITPHTNQQKLFVEQISKLPEWDYFQNSMGLKIMTFDTCQGEERDLIFYSMVATEKSDKLWGVFIKDLANVDIEEDGQIKAQRLNVGFSRGKECIHFVLSKPLDKFSGSIGEALRHYAYELEEAKKERSVAETDAKSKMEPEVLNWFYQTNFWKKNQEKITFIPQFEIGKYLKQLDPTYTHPMYKVDFLVSYRESENREKKIVIEYDGFSEHFKESSLVNEYNYQHYQSDGDVYRQKVLESYGYKFLRINKFNAGINEVETLDKRLAELIKPEAQSNPLMFKIHETIENLQSGDMKECPKCKEVRTLEEFKDASLSSGMGRFCRSCKGVTVSAARKQSKSGAGKSGGTCPTCGAKLVRRSGRYGYFYGCSRYPYCKGKK
jgi:very-short-patch-repair endonuclease